jgi:branched-chain amino acid transport system ATP-binding protein
MTAPLVAMKSVDSGYDGSRVIVNFSIEVDSGEAVTLIGRNGMGKTTALNTIFGLLPVISGRVFVRGKDMTGAPPHDIANAGLGYVPEGRQVFPRLSAEENLLATAKKGRCGRWTLSSVYKLFPQLAERRKNLGTELSGGEQQLLAIGRALMTNPDLLVLDEAAEGLAPIIREEIWSALAALRNEGLSILIVDKDLTALTRLGNRHIVLEKGEVAWTGNSADMAANRSRVEGYLGL